MEAITGTANSLRPARPIRAVTVAIEPGPGNREGGEDEEGDDGGAPRHAPPLVRRVVARHRHEDGDGAHRIHDEEDRGEREQAETEPLLHHLSRHPLFTFSGVYHRLLSRAHRGRYHRPGG